MQHVLVHIDHEQGLGPIGAWAFRDGHLTHFYPESLDPSISARARDYMAGRDPDTATVSQWFGHLNDNKGSALDEFHAIEAHDELALPAIVAEFRRYWVNDRTR